MRLKQPEVKPGCGRLAVETEALFPIGEDHPGVDFQSH